VLLEWMSWRHLFFGWNVAATAEPTIFFSLIQTLGTDLTKIFTSLYFYSYKGSRCSLVVKWENNKLILTERSQVCCPARPIFKKITITKYLYFLQILVGKSDSNCNRTEPIGHLCMIITNLSCHRCVILSFVDGC
jgi:hypothetical protein